MARGDDWLAYGRTFDERRFSPLDRIHADNVADLGVAWFRELPTDRSLVGTPLVVDGVMYFEGSYNVLRAVDATSGELLWEYDPRVIEHAGDRLRVMYDTSRGIAFYRGKVFVATQDGRLIAVDPATGREVWSTMTVDPALPMYISGAPKAFRGLVVIGNGGTEAGPIRGYLDAYDADTGERVWRWYTVPGEYRWHYQTTPGETWDYNSNMDIVLADLEIDGREVKAALHAPKNGFFYVLDRENGELISAEPGARARSRRPGTSSSRARPTAGSSRAARTPARRCGARIWVSGSPRPPSRTRWTAGNTWRSSWAGAARGPGSWARSRPSTDGPTGRSRAVSWRSRSTGTWSFRPRRPRSSRGRSPTRASSPMRRGRRGEASRTRASASCATARAPYRAGRRPICAPRRWSSMRGRSWTSSSPADGCRTGCRASRA